MNKFKVGDVVWWCGGKFKIINIHSYGFNDFKLSGSDGCNWFVNENLVKPIQREYAILG